MASELRLLGATTGSAIYAVLVRDSDELVWSGTEFVTRVLADHADYDVPLTETPAGSRIWLGDVPAAISDGTLLHVDYYERGGATPDADDEILGGEQMYADGTTDGSTPTTTTLISVAEYDTVVSNSLTTSAKLFHLAAATSLIEDFCGRKLVQNVDREELVDGTGLGYVQLSSTPASITSVTYDPESDDPEEVDGNEYAFSAHGLLYVKPSSDESSTFPAGFRNVKVIYTTTGTVPYALKIACAIVASKLAQRVSVNANVTGKSVGQVKIDYRVPVYAGLENPITGEVEAMLQPYKQILCI